jgi:hypothetical protein
MSARDFLARRDWQSAIERLGIGTAICCAVLFGCWKGLGWIGETVVKPLVEQNVETTRVLREQLPQQTAVLRALSDSTARQETMHAQDHDALMAIGRAVEKACEQRPKN